MRSYSLVGDEGRVALVVRVAQLEDAGRQAVGLDLRGGEITGCLVGDLIDGS